MQAKEGADMVLISRKKRDKRETGYRNTAVILIVSLLLTAMLLLLLFTMVISVVRYHGNGMEPDISSGETLVLLRTKKAKQGDIIAFYYNNQLLVRRVVAEGGQQISIADDGVVSINGAVLEEPYITHRSIGQCNLSFPYYIPPDNFFVMGDERTIAMDSRLKEIGPVSKDRIMGKVLFII